MSRTSVGIIAFCADKVLMLQRRDIVSYIDFMCGRYDFANPDYIKQLLAGMAPDELAKIVSGEPFSKQWADLGSYMDSRVPREKYGQFQANKELAEYAKDRKSVV